MAVNTRNGLSDWKNSLQPSCLKQVSYWLSLLESDFLIGRTRSGAVTLSYWLSMLESDFLIGRTRSGAVTLSYWLSLLESDFLIGRTRSGAVTLSYWLSMLESELSDWTNSLWRCYTFLLAITA